MLRNGCPLRVAQSPSSDYGSNSAPVSDGRGVSFSKNMSPEPKDYRRDFPITGRDVPTPICRTPMTEEMEHLSKVISELHGAITQLEQRLSSVLMPSKENPDLRGRGERAVMDRLTCNIAFERERVFECQKRVTNLTERLEVYLQFCRVKFFTPALDTPTGSHEWAVRR